MKTKLLLSALMLSFIANIALIFWPRPEQCAAFTPAAIEPAQELTMQSAWEYLRGKDVVGFAANLRAAGLSPALIKAIIEAEIERDFQAREQAIRPSRKLKFWQRDDELVSVKTGLALLDLKREKTKLRTQLFGAEPKGKNDPFNLVPESSRDLVRTIKEDYDTMIKALRTQAGYSPTPGEKEQIQFLEKEKARELGEHLSQEQVAELEMRTSALAGQLRDALRAVDFTEEEYRTIYAAHQKLDRHKRRELGDEPPPQSSLEEGNRREAEVKGIKADLMVSLGEKRYADYLRANEFDYARLVDLTRRTGVSDVAAEQAFSIRDTVAKESHRIQDNATLTLEQKLTAMKDLFERTRTQILSVLGSSSGEAYAQACPWLKQVAKGAVVEFRENGWGYRPLLPEPDED